jgi:hypothetical protein
MAQGGHGPIPPLPPLVASHEALVAARANCAARRREIGQHELAASYEQGAQDLGWAIRHEVARLRNLPAVQENACG